MCARRRLLRSVLQWWRKWRERVGCACCQGALCSCIAHQPVNRILALGPHLQVALGPHSRQDAHKARVEELPLPRDVMRQDAVCRHGAFC